MKKIILFIILATPFAVRAQVAKGDVFVGGTLDFQSTKVTGQEARSSFNLNPQVGYLFTDKDAFGAGLLIGNTKDGNNKTTSFGFDLFYRHYFPITESFAFVLHPQLDVEFDKESDFDTEDVKTTTLALQVMPRFVFFPSKNWSFEAGYGTIGYISSKDKVQNFDQTTSAFVFQLGTVNLGVFYYIR